MHIFAVNVEQFPFEDSVKFQEVISSKFIELLFDNADESIFAVDVRLVFVSGLRM